MKLGNKTAGQIQSTNCIAYRWHSKLLSVTIGSQTLMGEMSCPQSYPYCPDILRHFMNKRADIE